MARRKVPIAISSFGNYVFQRNAIGVLKRTLQHRLGDFEADEVVVAIRGIAILRDLSHIKTKFGANVGFGIVLVRDFLTELLAKIGKQKGYGLVHRGMSHVIGRVVSESAQSEGEFVQIAGFLRRLRMKSPLRT